MFSMIIAYIVYVQICKKIKLKKSKVDAQISIPMVRQKKIYDYLLRIWYLCIFTPVCKLIRLELQWFDKGFELSIFIVIVFVVVRDYGEIMGSFGA